VYCAGTAWDGNRGTDQQIAERLSSFAPVLYVDPPQSIVERAGGWRLRRRAIRPRLDSIGPRMARLTPAVLPARTRRFVRKLTAWILRKAIADATRSLGADVAVVVSASTWPVFGVCGEARKVYFVTDDFQAGAVLMGLSLEWLVEQESSALAAADTVIAVSNHLASVLETRGARDVVVIENGVDDVAFRRTDEAPWPKDVTLAPPIAGLIGHLSERIDLRVLRAIANSGCSLLLVGPRSATSSMAGLDELLARPNVQWVGAKPFRVLPSYMRAIHVGLLPYADTAFNRSSFPLKVLEYLAAGRDVVASDLPAIRELGEVVRLASSPADFASEVVIALGAPRDQEAVTRRRAIAHVRSWDRVALRFAEAVGLSRMD
jgi:teichuronic acid biosynthesis glycosyltransferase TuaH